MKKTIIGICMALLLINVVYAEMIPIDIKSTVHITKNDELDLYLPGDYIRHLEWSNTSDPENFTFNYIYYYDLNQSLYCTDCAEKVPIYEDISEGMVEMMGVCQQTYDFVNKSSYCMDALAKSKVDALGFERKYEIELVQKEECVRELGEERNNTIYYKEDYDSCNSKLSAQAGIDTELRTCKSDLRDCESSKSNGNFIWFLAGAGIAWFFTRKKNKESHPDHEELGTHSDVIHYRKEPKDMHIKRFQ